MPTVRPYTVDGFDTAVFPFTTDIPFLRSLGHAAAVRSRQVPARSFLTHTADEHISLEEFDAAVGTYVRLARALL